MSEFVNILGIRVRKSIIKKYYADEDSIYVTVVYNETEGGGVDEIDIPHDGKAPQGLRVLDEIFVFEK